MKSAIGIDPSFTSTGIIWICDDSQRRPPMEWQATIFKEAKSKKSMPIHKRAIDIAFHIKDWVNAHERCPIFIEGLAYGAPNPKTLGDLGVLLGSITSQLYSDDRYIEIVSVKKVRKWLVGNGNANKTQAANVVAEKFSIFSDEQDITDAAAVALWGLYKLYVYF